MFKKIVCAVDFSEFTGQIADYAFAVARKFESELHLLHISPNLNYFTPYESFLTPENLVAIDRNIELEVERDFNKILSKHDYPAQTVIKKGIAFVEIIDYVREAEADLVVMGTHGRSGVEHILIGSVAEKVVRKAPCPVLTIRPKGKQFKMP